MNLFVLDIYFILTCLSLMSCSDVNSQLWKTKDKETMCQWKMNQCMLNQSNCTPNENKITLYVSTEFFERAVKSASSYSKIVRSSSVFKKTLNQLSTSASLSGSYGGFSASASASYQSLSDSVSSTENYEETIQSEKTEFNTGFLQIIRETTTRVTIDGISASVSESKFVDSVPTGESLSASQLHQRAEDYMELTFGQNGTVRNTFQETICQEKRSKDCFEVAINYQGMDYLRYEEIQHASTCAQLCEVRDPCLAWTWLAMPVNGQPGQRCWLKNGIPKSSHLVGVVSGKMGCNAKQTLQDEDCFEVAIDYQGMDYLRYDEIQHASTCAQLCEVRDPCLAWTWLAKPVNGQPAQRCWLKNGIPKPSYLVGVVSGKKGCSAF